jgi:hypothetical protein
MMPTAAAALFFESAKYVDHASEEARLRTCEQSGFLGGLSDDSHDAFLLAANSPLLAQIIELRSSSYRDGRGCQMVQPLSVEH